MEIIQESASSSAMPSTPSDLLAAVAERARAESDSTPTQHGSKDTSPSGTTRASVKDLPDLTGRLIKEGLHEEYLRYRARYLMWRQGSARGAAGELTELGTARRQGPEDHLQELWHPTPQKFDFFYTVSYWVAVVSEVGALLLTFAYLAPLLQLQDALHDRLLHFIDSFGDVCFTISTYLGYFELINIQESGRIFYLMPAWGPVRERLSMESLVGVVSLFLAMLIWDISAFVGLVGLELSDVGNMLLHKIPTFLGGLGFLVGGVCEVIHNWSRSSEDVEWWVSIMNCIAGALFFSGGVAGLLATPGSTPGVCFALGISIYVVTSMLLIIMWRSNDFGLTLLRQLNSTLRAGSPVSITHTADGMVIRHGTGLPRPARADTSGQARESPTGQEGAGSHAGRLSVRGVVFLLLYCWLFACSTMNCVACMFADSGSGENLLRLAGGILWLFVVAIVLTIHSSLTSVPNQQPYRLAMLAMRGTLFFAAVLQTLIFSRWLRHLKHPSWRPSTTYA